MGSRHPLPYTFAKANVLLLEDDGRECVLWAAETTPLAALAEVGRLFAVARQEHEPEATLAQRIAAAYAGGESSAAAWTRRRSPRSPTTRRRGRRASSAVSPSARPGASAASASCCAS